MLEVRALNAFYGPVQVLHDVNLSVPTGKIVGLVGANAAGKSTLMFTLAGLRTTHTGEILLDGQSLLGLPAYERVVARPRAGAGAAAAVPVHDGARESGDRRLFGRGARGRATKPGGRVRAAAGAGRAAQAGGRLAVSGGEQQMLAIGRALMAKPRVLLLDEPTEGLAPIYVKLLFDLIRNLRSSGLTVLIVEQNVHHVLRTADRAYVLENGRMVLEGRGEDLLNDERLKVAYLGL